MAKLDIYEAKIAAHDDSYNGICLPADAKHSFRPIPRGWVEIAGVKRFCEGSKAPAASLEVDGEVVFSTKPADFVDAYEVATFGETSLTPYQALARANGSTLPIA